MKTGDKRSKHHVRKPNGEASETGGRGREGGNEDQEAREQNRARKFSHDFWGTPRRFNLVTATTNKQTHHPPMNLAKTLTLTKSKDVWVMAPVPPLREGAALAEARLEPAARTRKEPSLRPLSSRDGARGAHRGFWLRTNWLGPLQQ